MHSRGGDGSPQPLWTTELSERNAEISPDGRWLAYESNETGRFEIYVRPFPNVEGGGLRQVSRSGGTRPLWSRDLSELFYLDPGARPMSVSVRTEPSLEFGNPEVVLEESGIMLSFAGNVGRDYDVSPDGERFLLIRRTGDTGGDVIHVVLNWHEELKRLVPPE